MGTLSGKVEGVVVLAEDNEDILDLYALCFMQAGFTVHAARNGAEAVAFAETLPVEAFVLDLQMPVMDGWEAIRRVRALVGASPYVLAVSAHVSAADVRGEAYDAGADAVLAKPIEPGVLVAIVAAALRDRPSKPDAPPRGRPTS